MPSKPKKLDKMYKVLQEAKKHLALNAKDELKNNKNEFICNAVNVVTRKSDSQYVHYLGQQIIDKISERLEHAGTYQGWLINNRIIPLDEYDADVENGYPIRQLSRHAWVDSMIKEFKAKDI